MMDEHIRAQEIGDVVVVTPEDLLWRGEINIRPVLEEYLRAGKRALVLDLSRVSHMNSLATGNIVSLVTLAMKYGGRLVMANVRPRIKASFAILKLSEVIPIFDSVEEAVGSFKKE